MSLISFLPVFFFSKWARKTFSKANWDGINNRSRRWWLLSAGCFPKGREKCRHMHGASAKKGGEGWGRNPNWSQFHSAQSNKYQKWIRHLQNKTRKSSGTMIHEIIKCRCRLCASFVPGSKWKDKLQLWRAETFTENGSLWNYGHLRGLINQSGDHDHDASVRNKCPDLPRHVGWTEKVPTSCS